MFARNWFHQANKSVSYNNSVGSISVQYIYKDMLSNMKIRLSSLRNFSRQTERHILYGNIIDEEHKHVDISSTKITVFNLNVWAKFLPFYWLMNINHNYKWCAQNKRKTSFGFIFIINFCNRKTFSFIKQNCLAQICNHTISCDVIMRLVQKCNN